MERELLIKVIGMSPEGVIENKLINASTSEYLHPHELFSNDGLKIIRDAVETAGWTNFVISGFLCT